MVIFGKIDSLFHYHCSESNVLYNCENKEIMLIDFDWSDSIDSNPRYPLTISKENRHPNVTVGGIILPEHDLFICCN